MQVINGRTITKAKTKALILKSLGKKASFREAWAKDGVGVAGLEYISGIEEIDRVRQNLRLIANIETRPKGLLIYLNNPEERYYIILPFKDLKKLSYSKDRDIISPSQGSLFTRIMDWKSDYILAKRFLLEDEIVQINEAVLSIMSDQNFQLKNTKNNYNKVTSYLNSIDGFVDVGLEVEDFIYENK